MATEEIVKGRKYRILVDNVNRIWHRVSFWTRAEDVEFENGNNIEQQIKVVIEEAKNDLLKYLTASNGEIFQFAYDSNSQKYGFRNLGGVFNAFCNCDQKAFKPDFAQAVKIFLPAGRVTQDDGHGNAKKIEKAHIITTMLFIGDDPSIMDRIKIEDKPLPDGFTFHPVAEGIDSKIYYRVRAVERTTSTEDLRRIDQIIISGDLTGISTDVVGLHVAVYV